jgi:hypothetical protein
MTCRKICNHHVNHPRQAAGRAMSLAPTAGCWGTRERMSDDEARHFCLERAAYRELRLADGCSRHCRLVGEGRFACFSQA